MCASHAQIGVRMNRIKHKFEECKAIAIVTYKEWAAYRTHSMVSIFVGPVYFIVEYFIWTAVYGGADSLAGMELAEMIRYFGASALIGYLTMDFADWNLQMLVRTGKFLTFALRPIHHRFFALSQKFGHRVLGFFFEFLPCLLIFQFLFKVDVMPQSMLWTVLSVALAFFMNFYVNYCLGMLAFFFVKANGMKVMYQLFASVFSGALIPLNFFPDVVQRIMVFLPFQYTNYIPAMVWTGAGDITSMHLSVPQAVCAQAVAVVFMVFLSEVMYRFAIKRFTAVGA